MSAWRILEWSRELGRGAITSPHFERVEFDASCAEVDDFEVGEAVLVNFVAGPPPNRVGRVVPDIPRFRGADGATDVPALDASLATAAARVLDGANGWVDVRVQFVGDVLRFEFDDDGFAYGAERGIEFTNLDYVEFPLSMEIRLIRLATPVERAHLATRCELSASRVAVTMIDDERRFFFVVAGGVTAMPPAPR